MTPTSIRTTEGITLRQAALIAGFAYLLNPVTYAEYILPKLIAPGNAGQTALNIAAHPGLLAAVIFSYLISFIGDIVIAWSLFYLLAPVNKALSLLAALFQLVYAAVALGGVLNLIFAYRLLTTPDYLKSFGAQQLHAQADLLLHSFRYNFSFSLILFGIHLVLIGYLILRSRYIPRVIGILLIIDGLGWLIDSSNPYLFPNFNIPYLSITFLGEVVFMLWLLIRGWKVQRVQQLPLLT